MGAGCEDSAKWASGLLRGQVEQLPQVERGGGGAWVKWGGREGRHSYLLS